MGTEPLHVFVAWDSTLAGIHITLEDLVDEQQLSDLVFVALGYLEDGPQVGTLHSQISKSIEKCDGIIAVIDLPNGTVGWEIGYALAQQIPLALVRAGDTQLPEWSRFGLLRGQLSTPRAVSSDSLIEVARCFDDFSAPPAAIEPGTRTLLLCPREGTGSTLARVAIDQVDTLEWIDPSAISLDALPEVLSGTGRAAWIIPELSQDEVRDGIDTGLLGIIAGFLEGSGVRVELFLHKRARDQQHLPCAGTFGSLKDLKEQLRTWDTRTRPGTSDQPAQPPDPLTAWLQDTVTQHRNLLPFVSEHLGHDLLKTVPIKLRLEADAPVTCLPDSSVPEHMGRGGPRLHLDQLVTTHLSSADPTDHAGRWLVVAEPGAGKTTLARHLAWSIARAADRTEIPLYVPLSELTRNDPEHPFAWAGRVLQGDDSRVAAADLEAALFDAAKQRGRVWLFLDGLDEVAGGKLAEVKKRIGTWADALPGVVFVVLTRPSGADAEHPPPGDFRTAAVCPLRPDDQDDLVGNLLAAPLVRKLREQVLGLPQIQILARNPLLLTLIAIVAEEAWKADDGAPPKHRLDLYGKAVDLFMVRGWGSSGRKVKSEGHARKVLEELALQLQRDGGEVWPKTVLADTLDGVRKADEDTNWKVRETWGSNEAFLEDIDHNAGLLGRRDGQRAPWRFPHRSFREYLAAAALVRRGVQERLQMVEGHGERDRDEQGRFATRWGEVLGMLCGLVDPSEGSQHLRALVQQAPDVAVRALPAMDHLGPEARVAVLAELAETDAWGSNDLAAVAIGLRAHGQAGQDELQALVSAAQGDAVPRAIAAMLLEDERCRDAVAALGPDGGALVQALPNELGWLAARLCPLVRGLAPVAHLDLLLALERGYRPDWTADDLDALLDGLDATALWAAVEAGTDEQRLGVLWYALERAETTGQGWRHPDWPALRRRFLRAAGLTHPAPKLDWADVPAGTSWMGAAEGEGSDHERPRHPVHLSQPLRLSATPITQAVVAHFRGKSAKQATLPATGVDWFTARLVAAWLGARLPTEAEWEHACRAGSDTRYSSGDDEADLARVGWFANNSDSELQPVGQKPANDWGLHDMHGNVWEWCDDRIGPYDDAQAADPAGAPRGPVRVRRGGSCWDDAGGCRSASRSGILPAGRDDSFGFRVVLAAPPPGRS